MLFPKFHLLNHCRYSWEGDQLQGIRVVWPALFMGEITCYEVVLSYGEPG